MGFFIQEYYVNHSKYIAVGYKEYHYKKSKDSLQVRPLNLFLTSIVCWERHPSALPMVHRLTTSTQQNDHRARICLPRQDVLQRSQIFAVYSEAWQPCLNKHVHQLSSTGLQRECAGKTRKNKASQTSYN